MADKKTPMYFYYAGLTNTGMVRDHNEDAHLVPLDISPEVLAAKGHLYILADGMGGHQKGEIASEVTIKTIGEEYYAAISELDPQNPTATIVQALKRAIDKANVDVLDATEGGGTTVVVAVLYGDAVVVMNVGDSRAYLLRDNQLRPITKDHSLVSRLVEMGRITEEQALSHPRRNVLYQALGQGEDVDIFIHEAKLQLNDIIMLCSDGLWGEVPEAAIKEILTQSPSPLVAAEQLINTANDLGGSDNITMIIIQVLAAPPSYNTREDTQPSLIIPKPTTLPEGTYYTDKHE